MNIINKLMKIFLIYILILMSFVWSIKSNLIDRDIIDNKKVITEYDLVLINNTNNYRLDRKNKDIKPWYSSNNGQRSPYCVRPAKCERIKNNTCFGAKIPYSMTSLDLTDSPDQDENIERLYNYLALKSVPKCWAVIQQFLCAVYMPKCERIQERDMVYLPSLEMCKTTLQPCKIFYNTNVLPDFLRCNDILFPSTCNNDIITLKFKQDGKCLPPLVDSTHNYRNIEGCSIQCKDPLYTEDEHRQIHKLIAWGATLCVIFNLFVIATFIIDWKNANKYPALIIFYINVCFLISCFGWLAQFIADSRDDIICRRDGTLRHSEPSAGQNLSCVVVFILVYYFLMAAMVWFVILTYAWYLRAIGNVQDRIDKKGSYFHSIAWSLPLILTITTLALSEVDGNSIFGICFVGYINNSMRAGLLLGPMIAVLLISGYFIIRGMILLIDLKKFANEIESSTASNKIHLIIVRMGLCTLLIFVFIVVTLVCQIYEFRNSTIWAKSLNDYIICNISALITDDQNACTLENRPSVAIVQLHLLCLFGASIVMSSWCWTSSSIERWTRFIVKKCGGKITPNNKLPKHKIIARSWAKRKQLGNRGRISIGYNNSNTDPVGLNFDVDNLDTNGTNEISTTWDNLIPHFLTRRLAIPNGIPNSNSSCGIDDGERNTSIDSEISVSVCHVSVESRRNSADSQVSVKIAEVKAKVACTRQHHRNTYLRSNKVKLRNCQREYCTAETAAGTTEASSKKRCKRGSNTSIENQFKTAAINTTGTDFYSQNEHMKRRCGNAGLNNDIEQINNLLNGCTTRAPYGYSSYTTENINKLLFLQGLSTSKSSVEDNKNGLNNPQSMKNAPIEINSQLKHDNRNHCSDDVEYNITNNNKVTNNIHRYLRNNGNCYSDGMVEQLSMGGRSRKNSMNTLKNRRLNRLRKNSKKNARKQSPAINLTTTPITKATTVKPSVQWSEYEDFLTDDNSSFISISSHNLEHLGLQNTNNQSSYSGLSLGGNDGGLCSISNKTTHSKNSKTSYDIGIQTNAHEIVTQSRISPPVQHHIQQFVNSVINENVKNNQNTDNKIDDEYDDDALTENHQLLYRKQREPIIKKYSLNNDNNNKAELSESEKLKLLLLPSSPLPSFKR